MSSIFPAPADLAPGDLIWPKPPGALVPYLNPQGIDAGADRAAWTAERDAFLTALPSVASRSDAAARLAGMDYDTFRDAYMGDYGPDEIGTLGIYAPFYVGHVAMVGPSAGGAPDIVEALNPAGVVEKSFEAWKSEREGQLIWHGRLRGLDDGQRAAVAGEAMRHVGRPYNFWNFDLDDADGFYCSKLVWLAAWRAIRLAVDGDPDPRRSFWYSPKQLLNNRRVEVLLSAGDYTL